MPSNALSTRRRARLTPGDGLRPIGANIGWLMADNVMRMVLGVRVGAWVARDGQNGLPIGVRPE